MKLKIKKGDEVLVISGANKGQSGKVLDILRKNQRILVEGVNMIKKHQKARQKDDPEAGIIEREGSIHYSNVKLVSRGDKPKVKKTADKKDRKSKKEEVAAPAA